MVGLPTKELNYMTTKSWRCPACHRWVGVSKTVLIKDRFSHRLVRLCQTCLELDELQYGPAEIRKDGVK